MAVLAPGDMLGDRYRLDVFIAAGYGFLDGATMGAVYAALYNQVIAVESTPRRS